MSDFKVMGKLGLDGAGFFSTLNKASGAVNSFGSMLAGAFSVGAITAFSKSVLDLAGKLNDVSEALSLNVEFLQKFVNSAAKSGGGLGDVEKFLFETNKARQAALDNPAGKEAGAFAQLGFSTSQIQSATAQQLMEQIIKAMADGATPQDINALREIGGRTARKLVGGFKDGLDEVTLIIDKKLIQQLDDIGDKFTVLLREILAIAAPLINKGVGVGQGLTDIGNVIKEELKALFATGSIDKMAEAGNAELLRQLARDKNLEKFSEWRRRAKEESEKAPAGFTASDPGFGKTASLKGNGIASDPLLAVGNFLGAGRANSLAGIAEKQLAVAERIATYQFQMLTILQRSTGGLIVGN